MNKEILMFKLLDNCGATSLGNFLSVEFKKGEIMPVITTIGAAVIIKADNELYFSIPGEKGIMGDSEFVESKI